MNDTESRNLGPGSPGPISRPSSKVGVVRCFAINMHIIKREIYNCTNLYLSTSYL